MAVAYTLAILGALGASLFVALVAWSLACPDPQCSAPGCDRSACFAAEDGGPGGYCPLHAEAL